MISSSALPLQSDFFANETSRLRPPVVAPDAKGPQFAKTLQESAARQSADQQPNQPEVDPPDHADRAPRAAHESPQRAQKKLDQGDRKTNAGRDERDPDAIGPKHPKEDRHAEELASSETATTSGAVSPEQTDAASKPDGGAGSVATPDTGAAAIAGDGSPVSRAESAKSAQSVSGQPQPFASATSEQAPTATTSAAVNASSSAAVSTQPSQDSATSTTEKQAKKTDVSPSEENVSHSGAVAHDDAGGVKVHAVESVQTGVDGAVRSGGKSFNHAFRQTTESPVPQEAPTQTPTPSRLFTAQVSRVLEAALRHNGGSVTMRLKPDTLGAVRIDLHFDQGSIVAKFEATTAQAHDLLSKNLSALHASLQSKGFGVRSVEVLVAPTQSSGQASMEFGGSPAGDGRASAHNAGAGANGQSFNRREDPGGQPVDNQSIGRLAEDELPGANWRGVFLDGSLNAIA